MSSRSGSVLADNQRPRLHVAPEAASTDLGGIAAAFSAGYGLDPDEWQRLVLDDWLAEVDGRYAALTCGLALSRQNGKNAALEVRELFGMVGRGEAILHTAHQVKTARKAFKRLLHFFGRQVNDPSAKFPELNALVTEMRHVNGQEAIFLSNGGSVEIVARSQGSGRGFTVDMLVMDEAQDLSDDDLEALMPATSSAPLGNPQWIFTGTPPGPKANGAVFTRTRTDALSGEASRMAWHEWSVDAEDLGDIDLDDRDLWFATNPALGTRLQIDVLDGERARFSPEGFARERLGWWKPSACAPSAINLALWESLACQTSKPVSPAFGVATGPDRSWSAVAVAWALPNGTARVEIADYKPSTEWVARRVDELKAAHGGMVACNTAARGLVPNAEEPNQTEQAQAHNALSDAVVARTLRHGNQAELNTAVRGARWRPMGDSRVLDRKGWIDISPLDAAALALAQAKAARRTSKYEEADMVSV